MKQNTSKIFYMLLSHEFFLKTVLKSFMTEGPKFPLQANEPTPPEFWKKKNIGSFSPDGLISVSLRTYFTTHIGINAYG
jgi:hypothetical protein